MLLTRTYVSNIDVSCRDTRKRSHNSCSCKVHIQFIVKDRNTWPWEWIIVSLHPTTELLLAEGREENDELSMRYRINDRFPPPLQTPESRHVFDVDINWT